MAAPRTLAGSHVPHIGHAFARRVRVASGARAPVVRVPLVAELLLLGLLLLAPGAWGWTYKEVKAVCGAEGEPKPCRRVAVDGLAADGAALKPCWWKRQPRACKRLPSVVAH